MKCFECGINLNLNIPTVNVSGELSCLECARTVTRRDGTVGRDDYDPHAESKSDWTWGKTDAQIEREAREWAYHSRWI
jgi:hypothetical protein